MKKIISLFLTGFLAISMIGCGSSEPEILGTYETEIELIDSISEEFDSILGTSNIDIKFTDYVDSFKFTFISEFKEDGTYAQYVDEESVTAVLENYKTALISMMDDACLKAFIDQSAALGVTIEDKSDVEEYTGMTWDEIFVTSLGMTAEEYGDVIMESFDMSGQFDTIAAEGKYKAQDGKLYLSESLEEDISDANYETYEINENVVTITGGVNIEENDILTYPFDLVKVSE